jgi:hypothetical protein
MRGLVAALLLFVALPVGADVVNYAFAGDPQIWTRCTEPDASGYDVGQSVVSYINDRSAMYAAAFFLGDLMWGTIYDCECLAQGPPVVDCTEFSSRYQDPCPIGECNDANAIACNGGTAGYSCQATKMRAILDALTVPWLVNSGNHDKDYGSAYTYVVWQEFFSTGSGLASEESIVTAANGSTRSYIVVPGGGINWLWIGLPWEFDDDTAKLTNRQTDLAWARLVLDAHPGMPTAFVSHRLNIQDVVPPDWECEDASYEEVVNGNLCFASPGKAVWELAGEYPQVWGMFGAHDQSFYHTTSVHPDHGGRLLLAHFDDMNVAGDQDGTVTTLRIDPIGGVVSTLMYKTDDECATCPGYRLDADMTHPRFEEHHWNEPLQFCGDDRFDLPVAACAKAAKTSGGCTAEGER